MVDDGRWTMDDGRGELIADRSMEKALVQLGSIIQCLSIRTVGINSVIFIPRSTLFSTLKGSLTTHYSLLTTPPLQLH
jgi:hypothetical protein